MNKKLRKLTGFTLDQTILVVAVIAILATIIITTVAWSVISKANSTKLLSHITQISESIGNRYQDNGAVWPTNASELNGYLAGYIVAGNNLNTPLASPSVLSIITDAKISDASACTAGNPDCYIRITISGIQAQELEEADASVDGTMSRTAGRLRWTAGTGSAAVTLTYYAVKK